MIIVAAILIVVIGSFALTRGQRVQVLKRDKFECQADDCDRTWDDGYMLEVHHIVPSHMGGDDDQSNLTTLCRTDHEEVHRDMGDHHSADLISERISRKGIKRYGR